MICRYKNCNNYIPRPTPLDAPNGYCSYLCEYKAKIEAKREKELTEKLDKK